MLRPTLYVCYQQLTPDPLHDDTTSFPILLGIPSHHTSQLSLKPIGYVTNILSCHIIDGPIIIVLSSTHIHVMICCDTIWKTTSYATTHTSCDMLDIHTQDQVTYITIRTISHQQHLIETITCHVEGTNVMLSHVSPLIPSSLAHAITCVHHMPSHHMEAWSHLFPRTTTSTTSSSASTSPPSLFLIGTQSRRVLMLYTHDSHDTLLMSYCLSHTPTRIHVMDTIPVMWCITYGMEHRCDIVIPCYTRTHLPPQFQLVQSRSPVAQIMSHHMICDDVEMMVCINDMTTSHDTPNVTLVDLQPLINQASYMTHQPELVIPTPSTTTTSSNLAETSTSTSTSASPASQVLSILQKQYQHQLKQSQKQEYEMEIQKG